MQKQRVVSWLSQHNFPHGMIFFSEGLVHDPLRQKTIFLRNLIQEVHIFWQTIVLTLTGQLNFLPSLWTLDFSPLHHPFASSRCCSLGLCCIEMPRKSLTDYLLSRQCHIKINSAYGSMKDISVYNMLGLSPSQIYIVGRPSKKYQNQCQVFICVFLTSFFSNISWYFCLLIHLKDFGFPLDFGHLLLSSYYSVISNPSLYNIFSSWVMATQRTSPHFSLGTEPDPKNPLLFVWSWGKAHLVSQRSLTSCVSAPTCEGPCQCNSPTHHAHQTPSLSEPRVSRSLIRTTEEEEVEV